MGALYPLESLPGFLHSLHPLPAALAVPFSSVAVVTNGLHLRR